MTGILKSKVSVCTCSKKSRSVEPGGPGGQNLSNVDKSPYCYCAKGKCPSLTRTGIGRF